MNLQVHDEADASVDSPGEAHAMADGDAGSVPGACTV